VNVTYGGDQQVDGVGTLDNTFSLTAKNEAGRTNFGTTAMTGNDIAPVTVTVPEKQLMAQYVLGEVTTETTGGESVSYTEVSNPDVFGSGFDLGMVDSSVTQSVRQNSNLILVGGPYVNSLVQDLASSGKTWTKQQWTNQHQNQALIQLVENAFSDGNHALIVAGHKKQDTLAASRYLSNYAAHQSQFSGKDQVVLSSGDYPSQ
ncbi:MAG: S-layer protein, partial [Candidatus Nanohaloarchaea archaeon]|nr:S-layer protein [Candidatus Nanohaloarchaea archaeon]